MGRMIRVYIVMIMVVMFKLCYVVRLWLVKVC